MSFQKNVLRCSFCVLPFRIDVWRDCLIVNFTNGTCGISCNICNMSWFWSFCASTPPTVVVGRRMNRSRFPDFASNRTKKKSRRKVLATEMEIRFFAVRVLYQAWRCQVVAYKLNLKEMFVISNISKLSQIYVSALRWCVFWRVRFWKDIAFALRLDTNPLYFLPCFPPPWFRLSICWSKTGPRWSEAEVCKIWKTDILIIWSILFFNIDLS